MYIAMENQFAALYESLMPLFPSSLNLWYEMGNNSCDYRIVENSSEHYASVRVSQQYIVIHRLLNASIKVKHGSRLKQENGCDSCLPRPHLFHFIKLSLSSGNILSFFVVLFMRYVFNFIWFHLGLWGFIVKRSSYCNQYVS